MARKEDDGVAGGSDAPASLPEPRAARFGEGEEGAGARRERGLEKRDAGFFGRVGEFIQDVRSELKRVSWPTALEVRNTTIITIIAVIFFALYLYGVDHLFTLLVTQLERVIGWLL